MRSLDDVRQRAWEVRRTCLALNGRLLDGLSDYIKRHHKVSLAPAHPNQLEGGQAELQPPVLMYDERLDADPAELAYVLAHETGHLELHPRVKRRSYRANPIVAAIYLRRQEVGAVAAYSHKLPEETEAIVFANEVACPSSEVFQRWRDASDMSIQDLADHFGVSKDLVAIQLVETLYREALGSAPSATSRALRPHRKDEGQEKATEYTSGSALITAGPGTGKTRTLVRHAAHLLKLTRDVGDNLLVLTFSNEAAEELRVRIAHEIGGKEELSGERLAVFTFHGFGFYLVRLFHKQLGFDSPPSVLDEAGQKEVLLEALARVQVETIFDLKDPEGAAILAADHINHLKQRLRTPGWLHTKNEELAAIAGSEGSGYDDQATRELVVLWAEYERRKKRLGRVDFADLISLPVELLRRDQGVRKLVRSQFHRVLIDEYQDVSLATGALVNAICLNEEGTVVVPAWVVGDPLQGIYAFLGADIRNITEFANTFEAKEIALCQSYRSCRPVVEAANQLSALMDPGTAASRRLEPDSDVVPYSARPVRLASAPTDSAEYQGVADLVANWLGDDGISPEDIAVLARRNVDVREIAKALGARGISVTTSGIVTAEGAAGDVAAALTFGDNPPSALPRLVFALGRPEMSRAECNVVVARILAHLSEGQSFSSFHEEGTSKEDRLVEELLAVHAACEGGRFAEDGFAAAVTFLFESSHYLRRILDTRDAASDAVGAARANLALVEIATALGHAAAYRFAHPQTPPRKARLRFASHFQRTLARSTPSAIAPRRTPGFVQVMTCHASKGLEFPLVVVAGQRLPGTTRRLSWLPKGLDESHDSRQSRPADEVQADALLYVGLTRAERAVVVSYALSPSASGRPSKLPKLLEDWKATSGIEEEEWPDVEVEAARVILHPVWGRASERYFSTRALAKPDKSCLIRTYLQNELKLSFPSFDPHLYSLFVGRMRQLISSLVEASHGRDAPLSREEGMERLSDVWPVPGFEDHLLGSLYGYSAQRVATDFADALDRSVLTLADRFIPLDLDAIRTEYGVDLQFALASHLHDARGKPTGIVFHTGSLRSDLNAKRTGVKWGTDSLLRDRIALAMLRAYYADTKDEEFQPFLYSLTDGELYPLAWPQERHYVAELERVTERLSQFIRYEYEHVVSHGQCERCGVRVSCPFWLGAVDDR